LFFVKTCKLNEPSADQQFITSKAISVSREPLAGAQLGDLFVLDTMRPALSAEGKHT
jgi:hypothetical protein